ILANDAKGPRLATTKELDQPVLNGLLSALSNDPRVDRADLITRYTFVTNRVTYVAAIQYFSDVKLPPWSVAVVVPYEEFSTSTRSIIVFFGTFILLALGVGVLVSMVISRRISQPLVLLAAEANQIQSLHLEPTNLRRTKIREIDELAAAMQSMKTSLRSLEKLVPAEYARWLISSGQEARLGGERRHLTTYFGDIIGFTSLSHDLAPEELMKVLTEYLDLLSNEVLAHGGTIDKFNGDDVMAFWGAPTLTDDHALAACRSALKSVKAVQNMHLEWSDHGR
ncbi:MAG: adenylate/guanylate cyclase domain-containing protein, partial [Armatimonadota bacterium]